MRARIGERWLTLADTRLSPGRHRSSVMVPHSDLLSLLASHARREPSFTLHLSTKVTDLPRDASGRVTGVT